MKRVATIASLCAVLLLAACGFHPLYGSQGSHDGARRVFSSIYVDPIPGERIGYELRNSLIDNLQGTARPEAAAYHLKVSVDQYIQGIAVENNAAVTRYNYTLNARYELSEARSGKVLRSGLETTLSAYDVVASPYATQVAQEDAQKRGAQDIAYRIQIALAVYFAKHPTSVAAR
ncbi:MAG: LPS assembly lipoprotein LptE [Rhizomicrobium sp.]